MSLRANQSCTENQPVLHVGNKHASSLRTSSPLANVCLRVPFTRDFSQLPQNGELACRLTQQEHILLSHVHYLWS